MERACAVRNDDFSARKQSSGQQYSHAGAAQDLRVWIPNPDGK